MQGGYEAVESPRAAFRSRSRVVGAATFLFAAGALAHLGRTAQRPGAAELLHHSWGCLDTMESARS